MTLRDALALGRVSNLPTVWTNLLAALVLAGGATDDARALALLVALTLAYVGGMYLNDAFDAGIDARERPERPIPAGRVSRGLVFLIGFSMLAATLLILLWAGTSLDGGTGPWAVLGGLGLAAAIVVYDAWHKGNPIGPVIMGACRLLVYVTAGLAVALPLPAALLLGGALLMSHVIGLTYVAKQETLGRVENLWPLLFLAAPLVYGAIRLPEQPLAGLFLLLLAALVAWALRLVVRRGPGDIPRAVVSLIAGVSLVDALLIATTGAAALAALAVAGFLLTLVLQRWVSGT